MKQRSTSFWLLTTKGLDDSTGTQICSMGQKTDTSHGGRLLPPRAALVGREGHVLLHLRGPKRPSGPVPSACPTAGIGACQCRSFQHPLGATQTRAPRIRGCFRDPSLRPAAGCGDSRHTAGPRASGELRPGSLPPGARSQRHTSFGHWSLEYRKPWKPKHLGLIHSKL